MARLARSFLALVLTVAVAGAAFANPPGPSGVGGADRGGGMFDSGQTIDRIPLTFADQYKVTILYLFLVTSSQIFTFETLNAVWQRSENRLPLARIPLLGQLARADYERADFAAEKQVGTYYQAGKSLLIDLRPTAAQAAPSASVNINWDALEAKLSAEAKRPVEGQILIESRANAAATPARTVNVLNRDSSYSMLLGGQALREEAREELMKFISTLPLVGHMFRHGAVMQKDTELLILVPPSIVERAWY
jgi:hypothetical protein